MCTPCTAVTTPIFGLAIWASSAISPPAYMPISSTAARWSGPEAQERQRQPDLVVEVALVAQRPVRRRRARPRRPPSSTSWRCCPVTPTTSGSNRDRQPAAIAPSATRPSGNGQDGHVAEGVEHGLGDGSRDDEGGRAGDGGVGEEAVAVGALAGQRDEQLAGRDEPRVDGGPADRPRAGAQQAAAGQASEVVGGEEGLSRFRGSGRPRWAAAGPRRSRPQVWHRARSSPRPAPITGRPAR